MILKKEYKLVIFLIVITYLFADVWQKIYILMKQLFILGNLL